MVRNRVSNDIAGAEQEAFELLTRSEGESFDESVLEDGIGDLRANRDRLGGSAAQRSKASDQPCVVVAIREDDLVLQIVVHHLAHTVGLGA